MWTFPEFGSLVGIPVFRGKLGTVSPSVHLTLRAGLGQPQAVFLHLWHSWEIKGRGGRSEDLPGDHYPILLS